ncbi:Conidiation-specific protein 13 [Cladobotryum mycophilum]|uniref:Conidiation-specific protein 13 n=1 Tax=Cladobotryum mycophilum TaxID=491253 RepID=A0ABR0SPQ1_9HYPO
MVAAKVSQLFALASASLLAQVSARLDKPLIQPPIPGLDNGLFQNLPARGSTKSQWQYGLIPDRCRDVANAEKHTPYEVEVYSVQYDDCPDAWVFCRHKDATPSIDQMIEVFGRLPVRIRDYVRTTIAMPGPRSAYTYSDLGDNIYFGDFQNYPTLFVHEIGHTMDNNVYHKGSDFSASQQWLNAYNQDSAISDDYARTNQAENVAQETVIALFNTIVPGGIRSVEPNAAAISHQYTALQNVLGDILHPGGQCQNRFQNAGVVCMGPDAPCPNQVESHIPFNLTLSDAVMPIPVRQGPGKKVCTLHE